MEERPLITPKQGCRGRKIPPFSLPLLPPSPLSFPSSFFLLPFLSPLSFFCFLFRMRLQNIYTQREGVENRDWRQRKGKKNFLVWDFRGIRRAQDKVGSGTPFSIIVSIYLCLSSELVLLSFSSTLFLLSHFCTYGLTRVHVHLCVCMHVYAQVSMVCNTLTILKQFHSAQSPPASRLCACWGTDRTFW